MSSMMSHSRRDFLKKSSAGAAAIMSAGALLCKTEAAGGWSNGLQINPSIDNLRVAFIQDSAVGTGHMIKQKAYNNWADAQAKSINQDVVMANMDTLAMALARTDTAAQAWETIFQRPKSKTWSEVKVAIKVNAFGTLNPSIGVLKALVNALTTGLGVLPGNIRIFDEGYTENTPQQYGGANIPGIIAGKPSASPPTKPINVVDRSGMLPMRYCTFLDTTDILITCAVNKSHDQAQLGKVTMALKNHVGTIWNETGPKCPNHTDTQLTSMNKSAAIIGNPDPTQGIPARQQLAVVDSIFASRDASYLGTVDEKHPGSFPGMIWMGTLAGPVDYLGVHKVRIPICQLAADYHNMAAVRRYLTEFGYSDAMAAEILTMNPQTDASGRGWVDAGTYTATYRRMMATDDTIHRVVEVRLNGSRMRGAATRVSLGPDDRIKSVEIYTLTGALVKNLYAGDIRGNLVSYVWDGANEQGCCVGSGTYLIKVQGIASASTGVLQI
jgi:hypothetical protein